MTTKQKNMNKKGHIYCRWTKIKWNKEVNKSKNKISIIKQKKLKQENQCHSELVTVGDAPFDEGCLFDACLCNNTYDKLIACGTHTSHTCVAM